MHTDPPISPRPSCPRTGRPCPAVPCAGEEDPAACAHWDRLVAWRAVPFVEQAAHALGSFRPALDPRVRDAVNACPDRGSVLPISRQDDCGCRGRELTECRAGRGTHPGKVTLADCLACKAARIDDPG